VSATSVPPHAIIDDFLDQDTASRLLEHALKNRNLFQPATTTKDGETSQAREDRRAASFADLGPASKEFSTAVEERFDDLCQAIGMQPFALAGMDIELAVHRDGGFFLPHIDTMTAADRGIMEGDRLISLVYYMHLPGARFSGGHLSLLPFVGDAEPRSIAPRRNRLVAFPSFARHEVERISVPGDAWEDARFSINCWLLRGRN
jgi:SM-20-related protein